MSTMTSLYNAVTSSMRPNLVARVGLRSKNAVAGFTARNVSRMANMFSLNSGMGTCCPVPAVMLSLLPRNSTTRSGRNGPIISGNVMRVHRELKPL